MTPAQRLPEWARLIAAKRAQGPITVDFADAAQRLAAAAEVAPPALAWSHDVAVSR